MSKPRQVIWGEAPVRWADTWGEPSWGEPSSCFHSELQVAPACPIPSLWSVTSGQAGCTLAEVPVETKSTVGRESHLPAIAFVQTLPQDSPPPAVPTAHQAWLFVKLLLTIKISSNVNALQTDCSPVLGLLLPCWE